MGIIASKILISWQVLHDPVLPCFSPMIVTFRSLLTWDQVWSGQFLFRRWKNEGSKWQAQSCTANMREGLQLDPRSSVRCPSKRRVQSGEGLVWPLKYWAGAPRKGARYVGKCGVQALELLRISCLTLSLWLSPIGAQLSHLWTQSGRS